MSASRAIGLVSPLAAVVSYSVSYVTYLAVNGHYYMYNKKEKIRNIPGAHDMSASRAPALVSPSGLETCCVVSPVVIVVIAVVTVDVVVVDTTVVAAAAVAVVVQVGNQKREK